MKETPRMYDESKVTSLEAMKGEEGLLNVRIEEEDPRLEEGTMRINPDEEIPSLHNIPGNDSQFEEGHPDDYILD